MLPQTPAFLHSPFASQPTGSASQLPAWATSKIFNDSVHGHVEIPRFALEFIDTPQFQRLRYLKQLGVTYFVFPGASHNRFEHSLGVCHLAGEFLTQLQGKQQQELEMNRRDFKMVQLAGLCHDLGHGPFSHAWEHWINRNRPVDQHWHHEAMSQKLLEYLIDDNSIDCPKEDMHFIQRLIAGKPYKNEQKAWLFDIVANSKNSVDVDKFDYLARDGHNTGMKSQYDHKRLMMFARVINNEICFHAKEAYMVYEMFHTRYNMHKYVYSHKVGRAVEYMVFDALEAADPYLKISHAVDDPETFMYSNDNIITTIESSPQPELAKAKAILKRLRKRDLYRLADQILLPSVGGEHYADVAKCTAKDIITGDLTVDDIIVDHTHINYAMKDKNPVDNVKFFGKWDSSESMLIPKDHVSRLIPDQFSEHYVRLYVKHPEKWKEAQNAFRKYLSRFELSPSDSLRLPSTPILEKHGSFNVTKRRKLDFEDFRGHH